MRIARMVLMIFACVAQTGCVTQRETIPPETKAELIRLGRVIINENEEEETRIKARIRYCELVRESREKYGEKSIGRQTVVDSFMVDGRKPKGLTLEDYMLEYGFERKDDTIATLTIYFGGWTGSYVWRAYLGGARIYKGCGDARSGLPSCNL